LTLPAGPEILPIKRPLPLLPCCLLVGCLYGAATAALAQQVLPAPVSSAQPRKITPATQAVAPALSLTNTLYDYGLGLWGAITEVVDSNAPAPLTDPPPMAPATLKPQTSLSPPPAAASTPATPVASPSAVAATPSAPPSPITSIAPPTAQPPSIPAPAPALTPADADPAPLEPPALSTRPARAPAPTSTFSALEPIGTLPPTPLEIIEDNPHIGGIDLTDAPDDLWQRVRNGFSMPNLDSPLVARQQAWYLNRPEFLKVVFNRSRPYLFFIVAELEKRGMPTELALLPMVESSYNPRAYSPAHASGLWQFIPSTGRNYRLQQNWWQDQRRDVIASTGAALDYLQTIYDMHGDWHLALASYNWGEGAVGRAIAKNQARGLPTDYASLTMPEETRHYVPKLQALKNILAEPQLFGVRVTPIANQPYFDTIDITRHMDVAVAARLAEMPLDEFLALNPSYNRPLMPGGKGNPLLLPADRMQTFVANLERHDATEKPLSSWTTYTLKPGDKLNKVAARFGMNLAQLKRTNGIVKRTRLSPGTTLLVPSLGSPLPESLAQIDAPDEPEIRSKRSRASSKAEKTKKSAKATRTAGKGRSKAKATTASTPRKASKASKKTARSGSRGRTRR
jgi:membrane-bound lytic murein transglycosylase D